MIGPRPDCRSRGLARVLCARSQISLVGGGARPAVSTRRPRPPWFATPEGPVSLTSVCAYHSLDGVPGLLSSAPPARPLLLTSLRQDWARQTKKKKKERTTDKTPNFGFLHAARKTLKVHGASDYRNSNEERQQQIEAERPENTGSAWFFALVQPATGTASTIST